MKKLIFLTLILFISLVSNSQIKWHKGAKINVVTNSSGGGGGGGNTPPIVQGYGHDAGGANTGTVYHVTNLSASGAGSLNNGLSATNPTGKTIVFDVTGTINARHLVTSGDHFTIDGSTAPYPGIIIVSSVADGLSFETASVHNVIVKGITVHDCQNDGIAVNDGAHDIAITNCTAYLNGDGNIDVSSDSYNVSVQYCIIGNHDGQEPGNSGNTGGTLITGHFTTFHHNLCYPKSPNPDEGERFPFCHRNYGVASTPDADIRNNVVWQYGRNNSTGSGYGSYVGYGAKANIVANYYKTTSSTAAPHGVCLDCDPMDPTGGIVFTDKNVSGNGINFNISPYNNHAEFPVSAPYDLVPETACQALANVLQWAGVLQRNPVGGGRNSIDAGYINDITGTTGCP